MSRMRLPRRTALRGLGAAGLTIGLPPLEAMQDGRGRWYGAAGAAPLAPPPRFVFFVFSNGTGGQSLKLWTPAGAGTAYTLSPALEPLADLKDRVTVVTGLRHTAYFLGAGSGEHGKALTSMLTGVGSPVGTAGATTYDQTLARAWGAATRIPSLQAICDPGTPPVGDPRPLAACWVAPRQPLPHIGDPALYFKKLFGAAPGGPAAAGAPATAADARQVRYRSSVLDYVRGDLAQLGRVVGAEDRRRLDRHLASLRELESQIAAAGAAPPPAASRACASPASPAEATPEARVKAMVALTALALECNLTRVAVLMYGYPFGNAQFPWLKIAGGDHNISHGSDEGYLPNVRYKTQTFASLIRLMDAVTEGDRTLLDNSIVLGTSDVGVGSHNTQQQGVLLAGTAGGQLRKGHHVVVPTGTPLNRLHLTILQALKMDVTRFGADGDRPLPELLA
jgi:hypothetical protein